MSLKDLDIRATYNSANGYNLVKHFYNPVLRQAVSYDRTTGSFSPAILAVASRGFAGLISTRGKIRLITSAQVSDATYDSIVNNNGRLDDTILEDFDVDAIRSQLERDHLAVFAYLYGTGQLEMKVAITTKNNSMFHQKIGIVSDSEGNQLSFSGSNNETPNGWIHNSEEFKVFKGWESYSSGYFESDKKQFEDLWDSRSEKIKVMNVSNAAKEKLIERVKRTQNGDINRVQERIRSHENKIRIAPARDRDRTINKSLVADRNIPAEQPTNAAVTSRSLFEYQKQAIQHWFSNDCTTIFEMATGTGKTFTSINALKQFREKNGYLRAVIVVPLTTLTVQWKKDVREIIEDIQIINTSTDNSWRNDLRSLGMLSKLGTSSDYIVITTYSNFPSSDFSSAVSIMGDNLILVTDEMHNLVTERGMIAADNESYRYKLGLSATPTRLWKPQESSIVAKMFGDSRFTYDIKDALDNDFLVKFRYTPIPVHMDVDEYEEYVQLSRDIGRMYASKSSHSNSEPINMKLNARARIKKNAHSKIPALEQLVCRLQSLGAMHHSLIYVDNEKFLAELQQMLTRNNILTTKFVGETSLDERLRIIDNLRTETIRAIVAIRCLDEGVDIPSAQTAFFLSNNTDPREYVQRLGRVLRKDRTGNKQEASVYDYLVMPPADMVYRDDTERNIARNLIKGELIRAKFFTELATNGTEASDKVDDIVDRYGFNYEDSELMYTVEEGSL